MRQNTLSAHSVSAPPLRSSTFARLHLSLSIPRYRRVSECHCTSRGALNAPTLRTCRDSVELDTVPLSNPAQAALHPLLWRPCIRPRFACEAEGQRETFFVLVSTLYLHGEGEVQIWVPEYAVEPIQICGRCGTLGGRGVLVWEGRDGGERRFTFEGVDRDLVAWG